MNSSLYEKFYLTFWHSEQRFCSWYRDKNVNAKHVNKWEP